MAEEKVYKHPITNIIMRTQDAGYARVAGYIAYDGETEEIEFDKVTGIEIAVDGDSESGTLYIDQSELRAAGLDASGTPEEVHERAEELRAQRAADAEKKAAADAAEAKKAADAEKKAAAPKTASSTK